jgi:hypothetical protein
MVLEPCTHQAEGSHAELVLRFGWRARLDDVMKGQAND